ncbi:MAG: hypothetical protein GWN37_15335 [Gammaproteobacteria bacterium]|nr:hypothetical protein [Gammaproteobacteria bacterium]
MPSNSALCASLANAIRKPSALPLDEYEEKLGAFLRNFCHRDAAGGWKRDKRVRALGPYTATLQDGAWVGSDHGTHAPAVIWYSREMYAWLKANRPLDEGAAPPEPAPVPDGAVMVKEMFPAPAAACSGVDPVRLLPTSGAAVMVRDRQGAQDGWFWGWFGWSDWDPDWPPGPHNRYPYMGFGQYCMNCHASARDNLTFASLRNIEGEPGEPVVFLSQHFFDAAPSKPHHRLVTLPDDDAPRLGEPHSAYNTAFTDALEATNLPAPTWQTVSKMPSETYDNVWVGADGPTVADQYLTSSQCLGCHDAGATGLQFDMTQPNPRGENLLNLSPYGTWRTSPMGLGGRDPVFYAQLASETETFHPEASALIQDVCLGCHGILGQRQSAIDHFAATGECGRFLREDANAVPWPSGNPSAPVARYGALARDGISCTACHRMVLGETDTAKVRGLPQNRCVAERQAFLNPSNSGFAKTFTGSFMVGPADELYGPFEKPKEKPMENALGVTPVHHEVVTSSEVCGSCHTVHLPVMHRGQVIGHTYEQTTYPEWAFSAYRTGKTPDGPLPAGAGTRAESCQGCHMPSRDADGKPYRSKIAGIQEYTNFPEADHNLGPEDIDLPVREGFALHTLVGLNVFFLKMAQQFPDVLGIRTQDPMLVDKGLDPLLWSEQAMLDQAAERTAAIKVDGIEMDGATLRATVSVTNKTGHKFPSGVGFRRAFIEFSVLDENGDALWASGRTDGAGRIVDETGAPIAGEVWWTDDCSARLDPGARGHQPHYQVVGRQDQAQIYQELVSAPPDTSAPQCGHGAKPQGALTTSFLSICASAKDNRILPHGFLGLDERVSIAEALGAGRDLAADVAPIAVGDDPDYRRGGGDSVDYRVDLSRVSGRPAAVRAALYYQAIPPYFLQDRFCTSRSEDTQRLYFMAGHLNLGGTAAEDWKLEVVTTAPVPLP